MVSVNPTPAQGFYFFDPMNMGLSGLNSGPPPPPTANPGPIPAMGNAVEDPSKKVRKPYTITKSRESWTEQEHDKFLEALQLFDRDWKKIEAFVGSKTVIQIRSHAQKYFLKVQKNGTSEHVPPPRPKRKATHPYPQKAPKVPVASQVNVLFQPSSTLFGNQIDEAHTFGPVVPSNCCQSSSNESTPKSWANSRVLDRVSRQSARVMPDFAQVYKFIGSVFDPNESGHLQVLKQMDPINLETVLLLMRNLCVNLTSPEFEEQRRLLASYNGDSDGLKSGDPFSLCAEKSGSAILSA